MTVKVIGYSERGMIGALCRDIEFAEQPLAAVESLLTLLVFPQQPADPNRFRGLTHAEILIEQSFSDFGDPDLVFLIKDFCGTPHLVFVEAKVHSDVRRGRTIEKRWEIFQGYLDKAKDGTSGLFTQMYRKQRLGQKLRQPDDELPADRVSRRWSLGKNRVVERAVNTVAPFAENVWIAALLPEPAEKVSRFFNSTLADYRPRVEDLPGWDVTRWGFTTWRNVDAMAQNAAHIWSRSNEAFKWNHEQIYVGRREPSISEPE